MLKLINCKRAAGPYKGQVVKHWIRHRATKAKLIVLIAAVFGSFVALGNAARPPQYNSTAQQATALQSTQPGSVDVSEKQKISVTKTEIVTEEQEVPFATTETYDGTLPKDTSVVRVEGRNGKKIIKTEVKTKDGVEVSRALISEEVIVPPVAKVVALGTKVVHNKPAAASNNNCDTHYTPCVKVSGRDLDCADIGHRVVVVVVGEDPHGFDRNDDGIGCESYPEI